VKIKNLSDKIYKKKLNDKILKLIIVGWQNIKSSLNLLIMKTTCVKEFAK